MGNFDPLQSDSLCQAPRINHRHHLFRQSRHAVRHNPNLWGSGSRLLEKVLTAVCVLLCCPRVVVATKVASQVEVYWIAVKKRKLSHHDGYV